jgi:hypothetical protein
MLLLRSDTIDGGSTYFPKAEVNVAALQSCPEQLPKKITVGADGRGVRVYPVQGRAVVFWSKRQDGTEDIASLHAAEVVRKGEKWIATRWMKDSQ